MKLLKYLVYLSLILISSCGEDVEVADFEIINETDKAISAVRYFKDKSIDTLLLDLGDKIIVHEPGSMGGVSGNLLSGSDSIQFVYNDSVNKKYNRNTVGKNPYDFGFYERIKVKKKKRTTYNRYLYLIKKEDFDI